MTVTVEARTAGTIAGAYLALGAALMAFAHRAHLLRSGPTPDAEGRSSRVRRRGHVLLRRRRLCKMNADQRPPVVVVVWRAVALSSTVVE
ncbi:hypothetical protein GCM10010467_21370 [Actinocorallia glomerata]|uniref:Secreted protein n=2 Tax=Actinomycetes TaxID=1760 RepID=A0ABP6LYY1_9MICC